VAPVLSSALAVSVHELAGASGLWSIVRWLVLVGLASIAAFGLSLCLLLVDWLLLLFRRRIPPTGRRAWLSGGIAPLPAYGLWLLFRPPLLSAPSTHALAVAGALLAAAVAVRLATNPRFERPFRFS
jgi:hypothetical protein